MDQTERQTFDSIPMPRYPNGERKLARDPFMQVTWGLLGVAVLAQLLLLVWLDVTS